MLSTSWRICFQYCKFKNWQNRVGPQIRITFGVTTTKSLVIPRSNVGNFMENHKVLSGIKDLEEEHSEAGQIWLNPKKIGHMIPVVESSINLTKKSLEGWGHSWVIGSGAIDHMTYSSHKFLTYHPYPSNRKVSIADGSLATFVGQWDIIQSPSITLKNMLHVPKLSTNLVYIHQLITHLNCSVVFSLISCIF